MKGDFEFWNLVHWARQDLGIALNEEFSISDECARELLGQIAAEDKDRPFMELVAAYGQEIRRILAVPLKDAWEVEEAENGFWTKIVQNAGQYSRKSPMMHWLAVIAKLKAIEVYQRRKKLPCQAEDWVIDFLSTVNNDAIASSRLASSDDVVEREEKEESAR